MEMDSDSDSDSDLDSKPYHYILLCTTFPTGSHLDPCTDSFPNGYCTHFRDGSLSQGFESKSISVGGNEPLYQGDPSYFDTGNTES